IHPCDVHTPPVNLMEAVVPEPEMKVTTRAKEGLKHSTRGIKKSLDETVDEIYTGLVKTADEIKKKIFKKDAKKELSDEKE
ncbi:MAG: hypothetical protein GPJ52_15210, partial [Candidatus Heimdallarchaeota archaeon]|nr:hypothetical protein [Candidatus Heimdallarchaeota archaeon]